MNLVPVVRHMLLCDDVQADPLNPHKVNILGLISSVFPQQGADYPLCAPEFCVFIQASGARGTVALQVLVEDPETERIIFEGDPHPVEFGHDPLMVRGIYFRVRNCVFPKPGLYWVGIRFDGRPLCKQPLVAKER